MHYLNFNKLIWHKNFVIVSQLKCNKNVGSELTNLLCVLVLLNKVFPFMRLSEIGSKANFICLNKNSVHWTFNASLLPPNVCTYKSKITIRNWLIIFNVTFTNQGTYECYGNDDDWYFIDKGFLKVFLGKPITYIRNVILNLVLQFHFKHLISSDMSLLKQNPTMTC